MREGKPKIYEVLHRSGLTLKKHRGRAGLDRETVRKAVYGKGLSLLSARALAAVLGEALSEGEVRSLEEELKQASSKQFLNKSSRGV